MLQWVEVHDLRCLPWASWPQSDHNVFRSLWIWTIQYSTSASARAYSEFVSLSCSCWPSLVGLMGVNVLAPRLECEVNWKTTAGDGLLDCRGSLISCLLFYGGIFQRTDSSAVPPKMNITWRKKLVTRLNGVNLSDHRNLNLIFRILNAVFGMLTRCLMTGLFNYSF